MRRAIFAQVTLATVTPQEFPRSCNHFIRADFEHAGIGLRTAGVRSRTGGTAQNDAASPKRPIARRIRGAKDCDYGYRKGSRQVHGTRIAADEEARSARERNQFRE
jgi:hypothetical protein